MTGRGAKLLAFGSLTRRPHCTWTGSVRGKRTRTEASDPARRPWLGVRRIGADRAGGGEVVEGPWSWQTEAQGARVETEHFKSDQCATMETPSYSTVVLARLVADNDRSQTVQSDATP